jgi:putative oxidoreductase
MKLLHHDDLAKLILRLTCGGILLFHGLFKVVHGVQDIKNMVAASGMPSFIAYGSYLGEFVAPILVILGYKTRIAACIIAVNMLFTIIIAHRDIVFARNDFGGWMIETNMLYMLTAVVIVFAGAGKFSLSKGNGTWD